MTMTFDGDALVIVAEAFTGTLTPTPALTTGKRYRISGVDLTCHANSVVCPIQIKLGSATKLASHFPVHGATAGFPMNRWDLIGINRGGAVNEALTITGGGTAAVLNGTIFIQEV